MKAAIVTRYGPPDVVVRLCEAPKPKPKAGEVLIRVHAGTVNRSDLGRLQPSIMRVFFGLLRPRRAIFGMDVAGVVEAVGAGVTSLKVDDRVFGLCSPVGDGAHAEYVCVSESGPIATMPENTRFEDAVVCEGAYYADAGLKKYNIGPAHKVMVYGASGAIGSAAVQLAKARGAEVTAVVPTRSVDLLTSLGADRVIDYTAQDFTKIGERFDYILDAVGKAGFLRCQRLLKPNGVFAGTDLGPGGQDIPFMLWSAITRNNRVVVPLQPRGSGHKFVEMLKGLMQAGRYRAVIDRTYTLDTIVDAYRFVATKQKVGIVVIKVMPD